MPEKETMNREELGLVDSSTEGALSFSLTSEIGLIPIENATINVYLAGDMNTLTLTYRFGTIVWMK